MLVEHGLCVFGFVDCNGLLVLQLIADVVSVYSTDVMDNLFPGCPHLVCCTLLAIVEDMVTQGSTKTFVFGLCSGAGVAVASSSCSTASSTTVVASTAIASSLSSSSAAHVGKGNVGDAVRLRSSILASSGSSL